MKQSSWLTMRQVLVCHGHLSFHVDVDLVANRKNQISHLVEILTVLSDILRVRQYAGGTVRKRQYAKSPRTHSALLLYSIADGAADGAC